MKRVATGAVVGSGANILLFQMSDLPCALYLNQKRVFAPSHLNFCSVLNYYTSELICFFHIHSVSAVLLLPLCATPLWVVHGLGPGNRCLQLYLGAEPEGLDPYCYCMFY